MPASDFNIGGVEGQIAALNTQISNIGSVVKSTNSGAWSAAAGEILAEISVTAGGTYVATISPGYVTTIGAIVLECTETGQSGFIAQPKYGWAEGTITGVFNPSAACGIRLRAMEAFACQNNHSPLVVARIK